MKRFQIINIAILVLSCSLLYGCSKDNDGGGTEPTKTVTKKDSVSAEASGVTVDSSSGTATIRFTASGNWSASVATNASSWCNVSATSGGSGSNTITVNTAENDTYDERNAAITIVCGTSSTTVTVTQKQKDALIVESNKVEADKNGGDITLTVKANVSYSYQIDPDAGWIHDASSTRGLSESQIKLTIDPNEDITSREASIFISSDTLSETVTIYQEGAEPMLVITQKEFTVSSAAQTIKIEMSTNSEYEYWLPSVDWISETETRAVSTYTHYIDIAENDTYDSRTAEISFKNLASGNSETVTITQMQRDAIIIASDTYNVSSRGGRLDFAVNTNVDFETKINADWIHVFESTGTRTLVEKPVSFTIDENASKDGRTGTISFVYGDIVQTVQVVQGGGVDMKIVITHAETSFSAPEFTGVQVSGIVNWGDGTSSGISDDHSYTSSDTKAATYETNNVDEVYIGSLNSISSIAIYLEDDSSE